MKDAVGLLDWRRTVHELYAQVRAAADPADGHAVWRAGRDELFRHHSQSPLLADDTLRSTGLPYWPYDPALRFEVDVVPPQREDRREIPSANDGVIRMSLAGQAHIDALDVTLDVWWLDQYAGGVFLPMRDATAGHGSYGGGRYLLDTAKGADLGSGVGGLVLDFNFLYHPSCRYNPAWECPLAPEENTVQIPIRGGERMDP